LLAAKESAEMANKEKHGWPISPKAAQAHWHPGIIGK